MSSRITRSLVKPANTTSSRIFKFKENMFQSVLCKSVFLKSYHYSRHFIFGGFNWEKNFQKWAKFRKLSSVLSCQFNNVVKSQFLLYFWWNGSFREYGEAKFRNWKMFNRNVVCDNCLVTSNKIDWNEESLHWGRNVNNQLTY